MLLNGPLRGRFAMRSKRSFSSRVTSALRLVDVDVVRENTAGTAERWARILAEVSCEAENRVRVLTAQQDRSVFVSSTIRGRRTVIIAFGVDLEKLPVLHLSKGRSTGILIDILPIKLYAHPVTRSSARWPSRTSSTSSMLTFLRQAFLPLRVV